MSGKHVLMSVVAMMLAGCAAASRGPTEYPEARRDESVVDDYHGTKVADAYRWLEDAASTETAAFVAAQNKLTDAWLDTPARQRIKARYTELWNFAKYSLPGRYGDRFFYSKNDGLQNQSVVYYADAPGGEGKVLLDPNTLSADGTVALSTEAMSYDGSLYCYGLQRDGSDREELRVMRVGAAAGVKAEFDEVLRDCKFTSVAFAHDNSGFYYNRYPAVGTVKPEDENNYNKVYFHKLGTPQSEDVLVYEGNGEKEKELGFSPFITEDGKYLFLHVWVGTDPRNRLYYREVGDSGAFVKLLDGFDAKYHFIGNVGPVFYVQTNLNAPRGRIIAIDARRPEAQHWKEIVPESPDEVQAYARHVGGRLVVVNMKDAQHRVRVYSMEGKAEGEIALPGIGAVWYLSGRPQDAEMFLELDSMTAPPTQYRYDFTTGRLSVLRRPEVKFDVTQFESKQVFYRSKDGTRVPMFIVHKKGLKLDGNNPTLLYGYGGFNASMLPEFSTRRIIWMENGGVFAMACLRGGEEYGEAWHQAGMLGNKQNVFDDFHAAAEWLIDNRYTRPAKLAINGGSNGGLLVAACITQRPELYGAAVADVPVTDMLRYHKFTVGSFWIPEYGSADDPGQFAYLYAYSPLHRIREGVAYPPTLITTADTDDRVVPAHAKKFAAALQYAQGRARRAGVAGADAPILLRVETQAGHGGGKPTAKVIEETADFYGFLFRALGVGG